MTKQRTHQDEWREGRQFATRIAQLYFDQECHPVVCVIGCVLMMAKCLKAIRNPAMRSHMLEVVLDSMSRELDVRLVKRDAPRTH